MTWSGLGEDLLRSPGLGFTGKLCVHPRQLRTTNSAFAPAQSMLARARRVLAGLSGRLRARRGDSPTGNGVNDG
jgi:citrate lyase beta subunit